MNNSLSLSLPSLSLSLLLSFSLYLSLILRSLFRIKFGVLGPARRGNHRCSLIGKVLGPSISLHICCNVLKFNSRLISSMRQYHKKPTSSWNVRSLPLPFAIRFDASLFSIAAATVIQRKNNLGVVVRFWN